MGASNLTAAATYSDDNIPGWIEILSRPPVDPAQSDENIIKEFEVRLAALFERYGHTSVADGCPYIVTAMALDYIPAFKIRAKTKYPVSGAPIKADRWAIAAQARGELKRLQEGSRQTGASQRGLARRAAENVYRTNRRIEVDARRRYQDDPDSLERVLKTPTVKTIQNLMSQRIAFPYAPEVSVERAQRLLWAAEERLLASD